MKALFILAVMAILVTSALAKHEEISAGPYNVSFDLNTTRNYSITLHPESIENNSSSYMFEVKFDNDTRAAVGITKYNNWQYADFPCRLWQQLYLQNDPNIKNFSMTYPIIDGKVGQMISTTAPRIKDNKIINSTVVEVWMDGKKIEGYDLLVGKIKVEMILMLPDNLTKNMLNTFQLIEGDIKLETKAATIQPPSISVRAQTIDDPVGIVILPQVISKGPGFVVVFDEDENVLGYEAVSDGVNKDVQVRLDQAPKTKWLYATLNGNGATSTKYWQYPFMPDAIVKSKLFFDNRAKNIGVSISQGWLDFESSTSRMGPNYDRAQCINAMIEHGYPQPLAEFYCD
ncbi:MAG: hypothetical protein WB392_03905 [Methanotrichaceae archaeon]